MLNEQRFRMELFRILIIKVVYENTNEYQLQCPTPELYTYWTRHYEKIKHIVSRILKYSEKNKKKNILGKIYQLADNICKNTEDIKKSELPIRKMEHIFFKTLLHHYTRNNRKMTVVKRDWKNGKPLKNYNFLYKDIMCAVDPTGGVYFYDSIQMQQYFENNSELLLEIINFSNIQKKNFITKHLAKQ